MDQASLNQRLDKFERERSKNPGQVLARIQELLNDPALAAFGLEKGRLYLLGGQCANSLARYRLAYELGSAAAKVFLEVDEKAYFARATSIVALGEHGMGQISKAIERMHGVYHYAQRHSIIRSEIGALLNLGYFYGENRQFKDACEYQRQCVDLMLKSDCQELLGLAYNNLAYNLIRMDAIDEAKTCIDKSLNLLNAEHDPVVFAIALDTRAEIDLRQKNFDAAYADLEEAGRLQSLTGNVYRQIECMLRMGRIRVAQERWTEAVSILQQGLCLSQSADFKPFAEEIQFELGLVFEATGQVQQSLGALRDAYTLLGEKAKFDTETAIKGVQDRFEVEFAQREADILREQNVLLQQNEEELIRARDVAEQANTMKSDFMANMSHEIRTPLNGILGLTQVMLMEEHLPESIRDYLKTIQQCGDSLHTIISDILDFSKIEAGRIDLELRPVDLVETLQDVRRLFMGEAIRKQLRFEVESSDEACWVITDEIRMRQVLSNLVGNALKFTERGTVTISLTTGLPSVDKRIPIEVKVIDTGVGIAKGQLQSIFESFTQADGSTTRRFGGTGLGLSIAQKLANLLGGKIIAESTLGRGSTFCVSLALHPAASLTHNQAA